MGFMRISRTEECNSPSSAGPPTHTNNEVPVDTLVPVHGEGTGVHVGREGAKVAVVVLDIVDAVGATLLEFSLWVGLCDRRSEHAGGHEAGQSGEDLHGEMRLDVLDECRWNEWWTDADERCCCCCQSMVLHLFADITPSCFSLLTRLTYLMVHKHCRMILV